MRPCVIGRRQATDVAASSLIINSGSEEVGRNLLLLDGCSRADAHWLAGGLRTGSGQKSAEARRASTGATARQPAGNPGIVNGENHNDRSAWFVRALIGTAAISLDMPVDDERNQRSRSAATAGASGPPAALGLEGARDWSGPSDSPESPDCQALSVAWGHTSLCSPQHEKNCIVLTGTDRQFSLIVRLLLHLSKMQPSHWLGSR